LHLLVYLLEQDGFFVFQGQLSENISLVIVNDTDLCRPANPRDCFTVGLYVNVQLEFINKPVYSLLLEVQVRNNYMNFIRKVINS
jgi:hypothetical protein